MLHFKIMFCVEMTGEIGKKATLVTPLFNVAYVILRVGDFNQNDHNFDIFGIIAAYENSAFQSMLICLKPR
jgi:hypothetical protein